MTAAPRVHLVAVGHVPRSPYPRSGNSGDHLVADEDGVLALEDVERLVLSVMDVKGRSGATRARHLDSTAVGIAGRREHRDRLLEEAGRHASLPVVPRLTRPECLIAFEHR
jgi:hypothetical protein